jgi:hypothetical protein
MNNTSKTDAAVNAGGNQLLNVTECSRELERENTQMKGTLRALWAASPPPHPGWPMEYRKAWDDACKEAESFFMPNVPSEPRR